MCVCVCVCVCVCLSEVCVYKSKIKNHIFTSIHKTSSIQGLLTSQKVERFVKEQNVLYDFVYIVSCWNKKTIFEALVSILFCYFAIFLSGHANNS